MSRTEQRNRKIGRGKEGERGIDVIDGTRTKRRGNASYFIDNGEVRTDTQCAENLLYHSAEDFSRKVNRGGGID